MYCPPPLPIRRPESEDYTSLGQDWNPWLWVPALVGLGIFMVIQVIATVLGRL